MSKVFTWAEIEQHNKASDCFLVIEGKVYDITKFLADHPGGEEVLVELAGQCMLLCAQFLFLKEKKKKKKTVRMKTGGALFFAHLPGRPTYPSNFDVILRAVDRMRYGGPFLVLKFQDPVPMPCVGSTFVYLTTLIFFFFFFFLFFYTFFFLT
jgi:hypothetical protein